VNAIAVKAARPARVLVIDDEEIVHLSLRRVLEKRGFDVGCTLSATRGLALTREQGWDLIIADLMMPELDGIHLLRTLAERGNRTPIVIITAYPTVETAVRAIRLGAVDFLPKPFTNQEILGAIDRALA